MPPGRHSSTIGMIVSTFRTWLTVPGYWRARRGQILPQAAGTGGRAAVGRGRGHYVALYNIHSAAIDKTIIDMLMASWQMDRLGRGTDLLKVVERVYFSQYSAPFMPPGSHSLDRKHFLFLERFDVAPGRDMGRFNDWYDGSYRHAAASVPGVVRCDPLRALSRVDVRAPVGGHAF